MHYDGVMDLTGLTIAPHALAQMLAKGFDPLDVREAIKNPYKITDVRRYPGQKRYCGSGIAVVIDFKGEAPRVVTMYEDGVVTPLRPDQINDPAALASRRLNR